MVSENKSKQSSHCRTCFKIDFLYDAKHPKLRYIGKVPEVAGCPATVFEFYALGWFGPIIRRWTQLIL